MREERQKGQGDEFQEGVGSCSEEGSRNSHGGVASGIQAFGRKKVIVKTLSEEIETPDDSSKGQQHSLVSILVVGSGLEAAHNCSHARDEVLGNPSGGLS